MKLKYLDIKNGIKIYKDKKNFKLYWNDNLMVVVDAKSEDQMETLKSYANTIINLTEQQQKSPTSVSG